jgi:hypothetical protein
MPFAAPAGLTKLHGLAIGYVAFAGLFAMLGLTFVAIALVLVGTSAKDGPPLAMCVTEAVTMTSLAVVFGLAAFGCWKLRYLKLVRVAAWMACFVFPIGTGLGLLTFFWLRRADVRSLFETAAHKQPLA